MLCRLHDSNHRFFILVLLFYSFIYLFIYNLLNDAFSHLNYVAPNDMMVNKYRHEVVRPNLMYHLHLLEGLGQTIQSQKRQPFSGFKPEFSL
jgi:hypothetical protein